jgi:hypothetical protein
MKRILSHWRWAVVAAYIAWALVCALLLRGGGVVLFFFGVWGAVWLGFSTFWSWGARTRQLLLRRRGYL